MTKKRPVRGYLVVNDREIEGDEGLGGGEQPASHLPGNTPGMRRIWPHDTKVALLRGEWFGYPEFRYTSGIKMGDYGASYRHANEMLSKVCGTLRSPLALAFTSRALGGTTRFPCAYYSFFDCIYSVAMQNASEQCGSSIPHFRCITLHHVQRSADVRSEVDLRAQEDISEDMKAKLQANEHEWGRGCADPPC